MSTWSAAKENWTTGDLVLATDLNLIGNDINWLKAPPAGTASLSSLITMTSTTFATAGGLSVTFTTTGGRVLLGASLIASNNTVGSVCVFTFSVDGVDQGDATFGMNVLQQSTATYTYPIGLVFLTGALSATSHTFNVRWRVTGGIGSMGAGSQFFAREI
jgi:hypothetical protein